MARERFIRFGESNPLKDLVESFGATRRRLKVSLLSVAEAAERKFNLPTERAPLEASGWPPELAPRPLEVRLDISLKGRKSEIASQVHKAATLEYIDMYPTEYVKCYIDGSAMEGTTDVGYGVYIECRYPR